MNLSNHLQLPTKWFSSEQFLRGSFSFVIAIEPGCLSHSSALSLTSDSIHQLDLGAFIHTVLSSPQNLMNLCEQSSAMRSTVGEAYMSMTDSAHAVNNSKRLTEMDLKTRQLHELILTVRESDHLGKLMREVSQN